jgi:hypothetical protein
MLFLSRVWVNPIPADIRWVRVRVRFFACGQPRGWVKAGGAGTLVGG